MDQWFSDHSVNQNPLEGLQSTHSWALSPKLLILRAWAGAQECEFLTSSQVMLLLLAQGPHFELHSFRKTLPGVNPLGFTLIKEVLCIKLLLNWRPWSWGLQKPPPYLLKVRGRHLVVKGGCTVMYHLLN